MNLFCFMLDGSTESIYEPANSQTNKDVLGSPMFRCSSGHLRCKPEWGGSDPSISSDKHQTRTNPKEESRRSCKPVEDETFACSESSVLTSQVQIREPATTTDPPAQASETTGRLKKLQKLVDIKNGHQTDGAKDKKHDCSAEGVRHHSAVLTCLSRRTEKSSSKATTAPHALQPHQNTRSLHGDPTEGGFWSPKTGRRRRKTFECRHARRQTPQELCAHDGDISSPLRSSEWDRFERLIRELDRKQSDLSLSRMIRSLTDLQPSQSDGKPETVEVELQQRETETSTGTDSKHTNVSQEKTRAALASRDVQNDEAAKREAGHRGTCVKGRRQSRNSLDSLYSLRSGHSSSSGVTSGSNCSSNRESLRLEDDLTSARQFCCRARVHTEFVPSPYDTESLTLKVGDVIDVIAKPPMGTWTGSLNGRTGNFKFIYVDVLTHPSGTALQEASQKSTVQEVLRRLDLEEYALSLQRGGYQTVDDLLKLRESDLRELNVTRPEHRERLLAAVDYLQLMHSDSLAEDEPGPEPERPSEDVKGDAKSRPRDSGCVMTEDAQPHFLSEFAARPDVKVP